MADIYYALNFDGLSIFFLWAVILSGAIYFRNMNKTNRYILLCSIILLVLFYPGRYLFGNEKPNHFFEKTSEYKLKGTAKFWRYQDINKLNFTNTKVDIVRTRPHCLRFSSGTRYGGVSTSCGRNLYIESIRTDSGILMPSSPSVTCTIQNETGSCYINSDIWYFKDLKVEGLDKISNYFPSYYR